MNVFLAALLFLAIILVANVVALAAARSMSRTPSRFWPNFVSSLRRPYRHEDDPLDDLHRRVEELDKRKKQP